MSPSIDLRENRPFASEIKFAVSRRLGESIREWARARLAPDPNASGEGGDGYRITSLYFDTRQFDVFHRRGSYGRSKYRIRRYGSSAEGFLERKLKTRGLVSKRRTRVGLEELARLDEISSDRSWAGFWYHQRLRARQLGPICQISYRRIARVAASNAGPIRLTLDDDIRALPVSGPVFNERDPGLLLSEDKVIIELKYCLMLPALFRLLVEEFALVPLAMSKYRLAAAALGQVKDTHATGPETGRADASSCLTF